ncbi:MAG: metallophosphoesterase [Tannerella sp.]|nr:metallophosphoesterase [Tannerella sp.]
MFFLIVFGIYVAGNIYIYIRGWQALEILGRYRIIYGAVFCLAASSFILTQTLRFTGVASGGLFHILSLVGVFWIVILLYASISALCADIFRFLAWAASVKPAFIYHHYPLSKFILFVSVCLILTVISVWGYNNARRPRVSHREISIAKKAGDLTGLRIAMISDIHLGDITGHQFLKRVVDSVNGQHPDIVLIVGDTFDGAPEPVITKNMGTLFGKLKSQYGTYAVSGNHEYIGERAEKDAVSKDFDYLALHGVTALQDTAVLIGGSFYLAGRKDLSAERRKPIEKLLDSVDMRLPVIMMDHQPYRLEKVEEAGVDLQFSGHTHRGQLWPINYITQRMYEKDWGYLQKGRSHFYISCGVGTWGPPVRTSGHSEIVIVDLKFNR